MVQFQMSFSGILTLEARTSKWHVKARNFFLLRVINTDKDWQKGNLISYGGYRVRSLKLYN